MKDDLKAAMTKAKEKRLTAILRMYEVGKTTEEIANHLDVSRQRIHQICNDGGYRIERQVRYSGRPVKCP